MKKKCYLAALPALLLLGCGAQQEGKAAVAESVAQSEEQTASVDTAVAEHAQEQDDDAAAEAYAGIELSDDAQVLYMAGQELTPVVVDDDYRTTYEIFVYSFYDSDGDGIGDLQGIREQLDYIEDLGCTQIWLSPVCPSPTYHKYDVTDYMAIDPDYGTMADFDALVADCHTRGIRVITDFVMNHTSSQHPWFAEAAEAIQTQGLDAARTTTPYVDYYHFSETSGSGYVQLGESGVYYEAQFWSEMPDVDLQNPHVRGEYEAIAAYWLAHGVDGFRLDATTYYVSGSNQSNIEVLTWFVDYVRSVSPEAYIVGEGWTDSGTYLSYLESGIDSMFNFDYAGRDGLIARVASGKTAAATYAERLAEYEARVTAENASAIDAPFYTNHDMARSAGYYSQGDIVSQIKLAGALHLLTAGNAFVYYGEELGMKGSGKDENFRAPMQWSSDAAAEGMCAGPPEMDEIRMLYGSLEEQRSEDASIYRFYREAIRLRDAYPVIARGRTVPMGELGTESICAFVREMDAEDAASPVLILVNTSESLQKTDLSVSEVAVTYQTLDAVLTTGDVGVALDGTELYLPSRSVAVLIQ